MMVRILTALVLTPIAVGAIVWSGALLFIIVLVCAILTAQEIFLMLSKKGHKPLILPAYFMIALILFSAFSYHTTEFWGGFAIRSLVLFGLFFALGELFFEKIWVSKNDFLMTTKVVLFVACSYSFFYLIRGLPEGLEILLFSCAIVWCGDIGALVLGKFWGKRKLVPKISPKKTIEGAIGGTVTSVVIGLGFAFVLHKPLLMMGALSVLLSVVGQLGDLHESLFKRSFGVKDSSNLLPGHGGMYDRADSSLFVMPLAYYLFLG